MIAFLIFALQGPAPRPVTTATFAAVPPVIDGRDDDAVWQAAAPITAWREESPIEDGDPHFRTTGRIAYDAHNLYVFLRAFDPHPDSIATMLARRDASTPTDAMGVLVDGYRDRRTGFEFDVNPSGVKSDFTFRDDGASFDAAWDGVWEVATRIDSLGWTAEFRIPLSQLRYAPAARDTFGIYLWRFVKRTAEGMTWPLRRRSLPGLASQFADLAGLDGLAPPGRVQLAPYALSKATAGGPSAQAGGDARIALAPNVTLNATVNPDFGQVEADPAELNLTQYETFFAERRPFFVEGAAQFTRPDNCPLYFCDNEGLFYSRRIGRGNAPILGAGKLTGRLGGFAFGALGAATQDVAGPAGTSALLEPSARYALVRGTESLRGGESGIGFTLTAMGRSLDAGNAPLLHSDATAGGVDFRHRVARQYSLHGSLELSGVRGTPAAITATQLEPIHNFGRPDGALRVDSAATRLGGTNAQLAFDKTGGVVRFQLAYSRVSPGFEVNDLGYLRQADQQIGYGWLNLTLERPTRWYYRLVWNLNTWVFATTAGLPTDHGVNSNIHVTLGNLWTLGAWATFAGLGTTYCDGCARGGPALRQDRAFLTWWDVTGDNRNRLAPELTVTTTRADGGRTHTATIQPSVTVNASSRLSASIGAVIGWGVQDRQWLANVVDSTGRTHYTFGRLDYRQLAVTVRAAYTLSTTLSLQAYAQPFNESGTFGAPRELSATPRAADYADRFLPWTGSIPGGVESHQLNANVVLRWEYRPGSTLFVVGTQNTFLIKVSRWWG